MPASRSFRRPSIPKKRWQKPVALYESRERGLIAGPRGRHDRVVLTGSVPHGEPPRSRSPSVQPTKHNSPLGRETPVLCVKTALQPDVENEASLPVHAHCRAAWVIFLCPRQPWDERRARRR
jgi:hypothetical protein